MKKLFFTALVLTFLLGSCGNRSNKNTDTHSHEDGTEHTDHQSDTIPKQESFEVHDESDHLKKDSLEKASKDEHKHESGKGHKH